MPFVGQWELILLGVVLVLIFGGSQVPAIGRKLGRSVKDARDTIATIDPRTELEETRPAGRDEQKPSE